MATTTYYMSPISLIVQYFTNSGVIAAGAKVYTYLAGTASTAQTTYTDSTGLVANPNPMTLSSAGRPASASGQPVAFWVPGGTAIKLVVFDASGNQLVYIDNIANINDQTNSSTTLQALLASAANSTLSGSGPAGGADYVANAVKSYATVPSLRAANVPTPVSGQTVIAMLQGAAAANDGGGGPWFWNPSSTATDNGTNIVNPTSNTGSGRWLRMAEAPFGNVSTIASASITDLGTLGTNIVNVTGNVGIGSFGSSANVGAPLYLVQFASSITLSYSGTLLLPGGGNIVTQPNDACLALYLGSGNWIVLAYFHATAPTQLIYVATTDQSVASSTTMVNDAALVSQSLPANSTWLVQLRMLMLGSTTTTQGYRWQVNFSGSLNGSAGGSGVASANATAAAYSQGLGAVATAAAVQDSTTPDMVEMDYLLSVATTGVVQVQFAQNSSSANATTRKANSALILTRVA